MTKVIILKGKSLQAPVKQERPPVIDQRTARRYRRACGEMPACPQRPTVQQKSRRTAVGTLTTCRRDALFAVHAGKAISIVVPIF